MPALPWSSLQVLRSFSGAMLSLNPEPKYLICLERVNNRKELACVFHQKQGSWHWHAERCETTGKQGQKPHQEHSSLKATSTRHKEWPTGTKYGSIWICFKAGVMDMSSKRLQTPGSCSQLISVWVPFINEEEVALGGSCNQLKRDNSASSCCVAWKPCVTSPSPLCFCILWSVLSNPRPVFWNDGCGPGKQGKWCFLSQMVFVQK